MENTTIKCLILGSREFSSRTGTKLTSLALLDLVSGLYRQLSVPVELLAAAGISGPSMSEIVKVELEDNGFNKRVVGFERTNETYVLNTVSE